MILFQSLIKTAKEDRLGPRQSLTTDRPPWTLLFMNPKAELRKVLTSCPALGDSSPSCPPLRLPSQVLLPHLGGVLWAGSETRAAAFSLKASRVEQACLRFGLQPWGFGRPGASSSCCLGNLGCRKEWALASRGQAVEGEGQGSGQVRCLEVTVPNVSVGSLSLLLTASTRHSARLHPTDRWP